MNFYAKKFDQLTCAELYEILKARSAVFMLEQKILCLDMDDMDYKSLHVFFEEEGKVLAYLRAFETDIPGKVKIGRVLTRIRKKGLGRRLLEFAEDAMKEVFSANCVLVDAQKQAVPFYEKCGFTDYSDEFMEEGIFHIKMEKELSLQENPVS